MSMKNLYLSDLVFSQNLGSGWKLKLKGSNQDLPIRMTQERTRTNEPNLARTNRGRRVSLGFSKSF